jgi:dGTPase
MVLVMELKPFDIYASHGRKVKENGLAETSPFLTDYFRILESKSYRRLSYKTQVFSFPEHPHIRTRAIHTNEVISASGRIAESLGLNTALAIAIAAGHDIGHAPYGHLGEETLTELGTITALREKPFRHEVFGVVLAQEIENRGLGLNLTYETLDGILHHARGEKDITINTSKPAEYGAAVLGDKIAYVWSDYSDARRYGYFPLEKHSGLVNDIDKYLGDKTDERKEACISAVITESQKEGFISFSRGAGFELFDQLKSVLYKEVYEEIDISVHKTVLKNLYSFISGNKDFQAEYNHIDPVVFIALLTDRDLTEFGKQRLSTKKLGLKDIEREFRGVFEILPHIKDKKIDYSKAGLDWYK